MPTNVPLYITTSWDDGYPADLRVADLLDKHGVSGTFYIPCANVEGRPVMQRTEVARLGKQFEVGGHTRDHVSLTALEPHYARNQITANKQWLEDLLGAEVVGFAYVRGKHNRIVRELVQDAGYRYARTATNFMSTPGYDRFQVGTTTQFFAHSRSTYLRNYLRRGPTMERAVLLARMLGPGDLPTRCLQAAAACTGLGGYFHLWGHSWELDAYDLWGKFESLLSKLRKLNARFLTNAAWSRSLTTHPQLPMPPAGDMPGAG